MVANLAALVPVLELQEDESGVGLGRACEQAVTGNGREALDGVEVLKNLLDLEHHLLGALQRGSVR